MIETDGVAVIEKVTVYLSTLIYYRRSHLFYTSYLIYDDRLGNVMYIGL